MVPDNKTIMIRPTTKWLPLFKIKMICLAAPILGIAPKDINIHGLSAGAKVTIHRSRSNKINNYLSHAIRLLKKQANKMN